MFNKITHKTAPILIYHRIAIVNDDPVGLCVTPNSFEQHLIFLKKNYDVVPLSTLSWRLTNKKIVGNEASVTFDDGYKDNLDNALPLLEKYNIPATIFITTNNLGEKALFDWDKEYSENDRATFLSTDEIKRLSNNKLIEIGAHTNTHIRLSDYSKNDQKNDIEKSLEIIKQITNKKVELFAYPFGRIHDYNNDTVNVLRELGVKYAFTNIHLLAKMTHENLKIPRINIRDYPVSKLIKELLINNPIL